MIIGR